jgi:hypothetical protein
LPKTLWAVWFRDHIHTDAEGKLAVFQTRTKAVTWIKEYGMPECKVGRFFVRREARGARSIR